jgi:hypothetical protein
MEEPRRDVESMKTREPQSASGHETSLNNPLLYILLLAMAGASPARASSILSTSASVTDNQGGSCQQSGTASASCSGEWTNLEGTNEVTFGGKAYGAVDYGVLHAAASGAAGCTPGAGQNCSALAGTALGETEFSDDLNITGGPVTGYLDFSMVADGTNNLTCVVTGNPFACGAAYSILGAGGGSGAPTINGVMGGHILSAGISDLTVLIPFGIDQSIGGGVTQVTAYVVLDSIVECYVANGDTCSGDTDYSNTAIVTGLDVLDSNMDPVSGAVVTAASGTNYNDIQSTPEPSTLFLLGVPLLTLGLARRAKMHKNSHESASAVVHREEIGNHSDQG